MLLPVRKEVAEFYQQTMRQVQESQPTHFQEVTRQPPEAGELPHCCQGEDRNQSILGPGSSLGRLFHSSPSFSLRCASIRRRLFVRREGLSLCPPTLLLIGCLLTLLPIGCSETGTPMDSKGISKCPRKRRGLCCYKPSITLEGTSFCANEKCLAHTSFASTIIYQCIHRRTSSWSTDALL